MALNHENQEVYCVSCPICSSSMLLVKLLDTYCLFKSWRSIMTVHVSSMGGGSHQKEEDSILRRNYKKTLTEKNVTGQVFEFIYKLRGTDFKEWRL